MRPIDSFARGPNGRPHKADPFPGVIRVVGTAEQREVLPPGAGSGLYWIVTSRAEDDIDFQLFRDALRASGSVGMGVVSGAPRGAGAVLLVPTLSAFALHSIDRSEAAGPFGRLFSQRLMTVVVDNWPERIAVASTVEGGKPEQRVGTRTALWGQPSGPRPKRRDRSSSSGSSRKSSK